MRTSLMTLRIALIDRGRGYLDELCRLDENNYSGPA